MKILNNILGLAAGAALVIGATGCDTKDSGGGNPGEGSGTKTNAPTGGSGSKTSSYRQETTEIQLLAQGSGTKPSKPPSGSGSKTNAPSSGSGSKTNKPSGGSGSKGA